MKDRFGAELELDCLVTLSDAKDGNGGELREGTITNMNKLTRMLEIHSGAHTFKRRGNNVIRTRTDRVEDLTSALQKSHYGVTKLKEMGLRRNDPGGERIAEFADLVLEDITKALNKGDF